MVTICTAAASLSSRRVRSLPRPRPGPRRPARAARSAARRGRAARRCATSCSACADVAQVGEQPLAADAASTRAGSPAVARRLEHGGHAPRCAKQLRPVAQRARRPVGRGRRHRRRASAAVRPKKHVRAAARTRAVRCGCSSASSSASHSSAAGVREHAATAGDDGRARRGRRRACCDRRRSALRIGDAPRRRAAASGSPVEGGAGGEQPRDVAAPGRVRCAARTCATVGWRPGSTPRTSSRITRSRNGAGRRADQPAARVVRLDVADHDPLVAQRGAAEHRWSASTQGGVAAPVDGEGLPGGRGARRPGGRS